MYRTLLGYLTVAILTMGLSACNLGPESTTEIGADAWMELSQQTDALVSHGAPPTCYGLRDYFKWDCDDGEWKLEKVGQRDIWCDGTIIIVGDETDCYTDYATYDCDTHKSCGSLNHVCPHEPNLFCRRPRIIDRPPLDLAP